MNRITLFALLASAVGVLLLAIMRYLIAGLYSAIGTAVAAIQNDREYVGFEVDAENYQEVIERRIGEAKRQREASVNKED